MAYVTGIVVVTRMVVELASIVLIKQLVFEKKTKKKQKQKQKKTLP